MRGDERTGANWEKNAQGLDEVSGDFLVDRDAVSLCSLCCQGSCWLCVK